MVEEQRRRQQRRPIRGSGSLVTPGSEIAVRLLDISTQGMGVVSPLPMPVGARCTAHFGLVQAAGRIALQPKAIIIGCILSGNDGGFRLGMQFDSTLSGDARRAIEDYVNS